MFKIIFVKKIKKNNKNGFVHRPEDKLTCTLFIM